MIIIMRGHVQDELHWGKPFLKKKRSNEICNLSSPVLRFLIPAERKAVCVSMDPCEGGESLVQWMLSLRVLHYR